MPQLFWRPAPQARWRCKRVYGLDLEHRSNGVSELKIIVAVLKQHVIGEVLSQPGLQARAPPR